ncbi:potassium channel family protein [bacterium]|nr:potassium channel family protein [bacterium]
MRRYRFIILLVSLLVLLVCAPMVGVVGSLTNTTTAQFVMSLAFLAMLVSAVFAIDQTRRVLWIMVALLVVDAALHGLDLLLDDYDFLLAGHVVSGGFLGYVIYVVFRHLLRCHYVTFDTICASLCVYLLLGLWWAIVYSGLDIFQPQSFYSGVDGELTVMRFGSNKSVTPLYYSYTTLTTLGYGDLVPHTPIARMLAAIQAVTGQIYLAVLVARLVGIHIADARERNTAD